MAETPDVDGGVVGGRRVVNSVATGSHRGVRTWGRGGLVRKAEKVPSFSCDEGQGGSEGDS